VMPDQIHPTPRHNKHNGTHLFLFFLSLYVPKPKNRPRMNGKPGHVRASAVAQQWVKE